LRLVQDSEKPLRNDNSPGPGHYKAEVVDTKKKMQSYKWGKDNRFHEMSKNGVPGPGLYGSQSGMKGPKFGFGTGQRKNFKVSLTLLTSYSLMQLLDQATTIKIDLWIL
jgi:hypothetical protein